MNKLEHNAPVLQIVDLQVALPADADRPYAIQQLDLAIEAGKTLCVVGESGSGKSVLATTIMGLMAKELRINSGTIRLAGNTLLDSGHYASNRRMRQLRATSMGMVFQEPMTALNPVHSCGEQVDELLRAHTHWPAAERKARILAMFERVRLPDPARIYKSYPHQLSGGQRQRIVIAMAIVLKPQLLICDEPTTALDVTTQAEILKLIRELQAEQGSAVLFITHDMGVVSEIADHILVMYRGEMVEQGACEQVLRHPATDYTRSLLAAVPDITPPPPRQPPGNRLPPLLVGQSVGKTYVSRDWLGRSKRFDALRQASVAVHRGETVGIVGESGSGKSTFARCMIRMIAPSSGKILWGDREVQTLPESQVRTLRSRVQVVFQDPNRSLNPRRTIGSSIMEGAMNFGQSRQQARHTAEALMDRINLPRASLDRYPHQFSGGQRQRLAIARAIACDPQVLVADEAVSALDVSVQAQILDLLRELQRDLGLGLLFITHDLRVAAQLCDRVIVMHQGEVVEQGITAQLFGQPRHDYTRRLLAAAPRLALMK
ncbi:MULTISPECIES: ABC transporter ATP-binding protein [unclassified Brenneria]|uniref:ABC transporter ATP-binding protein n=1 Tax=unclassified Brenneria TaxID=2634434 RepID=UPI0029C4BC78|nr:MULTISPECIES: ABC transporter ATP-binding protein [unclassified Brenneria]MDX5629777.1 ABC transporter ATP-binding protein [Brenneria sp. L3-3Z]MDX5696923.1 ABC transporter ATP-binding protein [Brenneria sp. L4-2C]MEE3663280.1 ABC transporter ATP-binding protein [Brenneria sp. g21c3]